MLKQPREFVFIMLKPAALNNIKLTNFIKQELLKYGNIKYIKESVIVDKSIILEHYKNSKSSLWYPLVVNYFSGKVVQHFILEFNPDKHNLLVNNTKYSFADFLRKQVIGPANLFKTKKSHIRRLALSKFSSFLLDNLIHCSATTQEALDEIRIWYKDCPIVVEEFDTKASALLR